MAFRVQTQDALNFGDVAGSSRCRRLVMSGSRKTTTRFP